MKVAIGAVLGLAAGFVIGAFVGRWLVVSGAQHDEITGGYGAGIPGGAIGLILGAVLGHLLSTGRRN